MVWITIILAWLLIAPSCTQLLISLQNNFFAEKKIDRSFVSALLKHKILHIHWSLEYLTPDYQEILHANFLKNDNFRFLQKLGKMSQLTWIFIECPAGKLLTDKKNLKIIFYFDRDLLCFFGRSTMKMDKCISKWS